MEKSKIQKVRELLAKDRFISIREIREIGFRNPWSVLYTLKNEGWVIEKTDAHNVYEYFPKIEDEKVSDVFWKTLFVITIVLVSIFVAVV